MSTRPVAFLLMVAVALGTTTLAAAQTAEPFDLLIRGGRVVDGTGNPWFFGDVAIRGDRIAKVGVIDPDAAARKVIDARGLVVSPGFIDMHSHSDMTLFEDGRAQSKIRQGVTTEILGEETSAGPTKGNGPARHGQPAWCERHLDHTGRLLRGARTSRHRGQRGQLRRARHAARVRTGRFARAPRPG